MPKCKKCRTPFLWKQIFNANFNYSNVICRNCGAHSEITIFSRFTLALLTLTPFFIFGMVMDLFGSHVLNLTAGFLIGLAGALIAPFLVSYHVVGSGVAGKTAQKESSD